MNIVLVHGMGRTRFSLLWLAVKLRWAGHHVSAFTYYASAEKFEPCVARLVRFIEPLATAQDYAVIGHSLGSVLLRAALPYLSHAPAATFLLAPPTQACTLAKYFKTWRLYRLLTGEMGQQLASDAFMRRLPPAPPRTLIFAGIAGPRQVKWWGRQFNDGILALNETRLRGVPRVPVRALHSFIMNKRVVSERINATLAAVK